MNCIADTNILFTIFWKNSVVRSLGEQTIKLYAPEYALTELKKYKEEIQKKAKIDEKQFNGLLSELKLRVEFISLENYKDHIPKVLSQMDYVTEEEFAELCDDIDFISIAFALRCPLWSNDSLLKKQKSVVVLSTKEVIILLE